jgi:hypothetical protein
VKHSISRLKRSLAKYDRPHGTVARLQQGCRCTKCRAAKAERVLRRKAAILAGTHQFNGIVDVAPARKHLRKLSKAGIGLNTVSEVTGLSKWKLADIRAQRVLRVRAETVRRIQSVPLDAHADGARVLADKTRQRLELLADEGFTQTEIAKRMGREGRFSLRKQKYVFARTEMKVEKLFNRVMAA